MKYYLTAKRLDITSGDYPLCIINEKDAEEFDVHAADRVEISWNGENDPLIVDLDTSNNLVEEGKIGIYKDLWTKYSINEGDAVTIRLLEQSEAINSIRRKLLGERLGYEDFYVIMRDIANRKLGDVLSAFFTASGYSPGLNYEEILHMTKALANTGDILKFDGVVADKHSIGGVAGKGVTPIVVPVVAANGITVPNTSTRAVTSASATTDMLEVIMPMSFNRTQLEGMIRKSGVFMVWGGGLDLAPADDEIIKIQKKLGIESIDKFVSSIMAKKIAQGVNHVIFDVPVGPGAKIGEEEFEEVSSLFLKLGEVFGIKVIIHKRQMVSIDGFAVGPSLECREFLKIYEQHPQRSIQLENAALEMAGALLEGVGKAQPGQGFELAKQTLLSGRAEEKLREIIANQGGNVDVTSESLEVGGATFDYKAKTDGTMSAINNKKVFEVAKALGNPRIKEAGLFFHKLPGDSVKAGDTLVTLHATSANRLELGKKALEQNEIFEW